MKEQRKDSPEEILQDIRNHQRKFTNGWDLKSIIVIAGIVFQTGYFYSSFNSLEQNFKEYKENMKETVKEIKDLIGKKADKSSDGNSDRKENKK